MARQVRHMIKEILLEGKLIRYELQRKKVKNINIRIKHDLTIHVSASPRLPITAIEDVLREKSRFILSALEKYEAFAAKDDASAIDDDHAVVFGHILPIFTTIGGKNQAIVKSDRLELILKNSTDREKALSSALDSLLREFIEECCRKIYPKFSKYCPEYPEIKFRHMKSRWGSCNFKKYVLTFNYSLVHAPVECIEYVVYHEFCHFIHPNHSADFYGELSKHVPDHKNNKKRLNAISLQ